MAENLVYVRCCSQAILPEAISTPAGSDYSQLINFTFNTLTVTAYNSQFFSYYAGDGVVPLFRFPIASSLLIKGIRLSIPNYPGARMAYDPNGTPTLVRQGYQIGLSSWNVPPTIPQHTESLNVGINELGQWTALNYLVNSSLYNVGGAEFIYLSMGALSVTTVSIYVDFRNYQSAFNNIGIYLLAELAVIAPQGLY